MGNKQYDLDELLKTHKGMNEEIFRSIDDGGVALNRTKKIDFYFLAGDLSSLQAFAVVLRDEWHYEVKVEVEGNEGEEEFVLQGVCLDVPLSEESMDAWVEKMIRMGAGYQCTFGGWGIEH